MVQDAPAIETKPVSDLYDQNAEEAFLGTTILESDRLAEIIEKVGLLPGDLYFSANKILLGEMILLDIAGIPIDNITLADQLEKDGHLAEVGGPGYIAKLLACANGFNSLEYARIIKEKSRKREALAMASQIAKLASSKDFEQDLDWAISRLNKLKDNTNKNEITNFSSWADLDGVLGPIIWDWKDWLAKGFLNILVGLTGDGKSILSLRTCGSYLLGWPWPDGTPFTDEPGMVIWCEAEAAQAINLERAKSWGLPLDRILSPLNNPLGDFRLNNSEHKDRLFNMAMRPDVVFIVVDSLSGADPTAEKSTEDTCNVNWLASLARDIQKPVQLTHHLRKRSLFDTEGVVTLDRVRGISTILQYSRLIWALDVPDQQNKDNKRLSVIKSNLGKKPKPLGVNIGNDGIPTFGEAPQEPHIETIADKAADLIMTLLKDQPMPAAELEHEIELSGISWKSAKRAKQKLGIVSIKKNDGKWYWSLPAKEEYTNEYTEH